MKKIERKLVAFLLGADISDSEFHEAARLLSSSRVQQLIEIAWQTRTRIADEFGPEEVPNPNSRSTVDLLMDVEERLSNLLLHEARLSAAKALDLLWHELNVRRPLASKTSFHRGLRQLLEEIPASVVYAAAQRIRNAIVHQTPKSDWPLEIK